MTAGQSGLLLGVGALCLSLLSPAPAGAKTSDFTTTLEYQSAPSCPGADALEAIVDERLGYHPFAAVAPRRVFVSITANGPSLSGRIEWRDAEGQWTGDQAFSMVSGDCLRLIRTMGLALAVQIQLLADQNTPLVDRDSTAEAKPVPKAASEARSAEQAKPAKPATERGAPDAVKATEDATRSGSPPVFALGAGPAIGLGMAPHPIFLGRVFGMLTLRHTSLELAAEMSLPATTRRSDGAGVSTQFRLLSAAGCAAIERINACLLLNAGQVSMAGKDIDRPTSTHLPYLAAGARAAFIQPLGRRAFVKAHANGLLILTRWTASLDDVPVWTMPRLALTLGVDMGVHFR